MAEDSLKGKGCGGAFYLSVSPDLGTGGTKMLKIKLRFEEALKLHLAVDECIHRLNNLKRSTRQAKRTGMEVVVKFGPDRKSRRIFVTTGPIPEARRGAAGD